MKVFLIGAAGGIGRRLAERLTRRGDAVSGMHRAQAQAETVRATGKNVANRKSNPCPSL